MPNSQLACHNMKGDSGEVMPEMQPAEGNHSVTPVYFRASSCDQAGLHYKLKHYTV